MTGDNFPVILLLSYCSKFGTIFAAFTRMKPLLLPALFITSILSFTSCNAQVNTGSNDSIATPKTKQPPGVSELQIAVNAGIDPYFVESTDTVSTHGPKCITRDVVRDRNGNIWLATWHGIIKYDGKLFTNYTLKENLIHFHVACCYEDKKGNLWFGTARGGVYKYDGKTFTLFTTKDGLVDNNVCCVFEDKDGNSWFGTENGLSRYDGKTFTNFEAGNGFNGKYVNSIIQDKTGKFWVGTNEGLFIYNGAAFSEFKNKEGLSFKAISLLEDKTGKIWIGRFDGLSVYDPATSVYSNYLSDYLTYYIVEDKAGNIWLSHNETNNYYMGFPKQVLYKYDGKTFTVMTEQYDPGDFQLFGKTVDKKGNVWFGTMKGLCCYNGKKVIRY